MNEQNEKITELTLDQMETVNGGARFLPYEQCPSSPERQHKWIETDTAIYCSYCNKIREFKQH